MANNRRSVMSEGEYPTSEYSTTTSVKDPDFSEPKKKSVKGISLNLFLYFSVQYMITPLLYRHVFARTARHFGYKPTSSALSKCDVDMNNVTASLDVMQFTVEKETQDIIFMMNLPKILPQLFVVPLMGVLSDVTQRRKFILWLPSIGNVIYITCFAIDYYLDVGVWLLYVGYGFVGLLGGGEAFYTGASAYIADIFSVEKRTFKLAFLECSLVLAVSIVDFAIDSTLKSLDDAFVPILWCNLVLALLVLLISVYFLDEPFEPKKLNKDDTLNAIRTSFGHCGCGGRRSQIVALCMWAFFIYNFSLAGQRDVSTTDFSDHPLCFTVEVVAIWILCYGIIVILGMLIGTKVITTFSGDIGLTALGYITTFISYLWLALGRSGIATFSALIILVYQFLPNVTLRSIASKRVELKYQATMYSVFHTGQAVFSLVGIIAFQNIYYLTIDIYQTTFYYVCIGIILIPSLLLFIVSRLVKGDPGEYIIKERSGRIPYGSNVTLESRAA